MGQALITRRGVPMLAPDVDDGYEQLINYTMLYDSGDECEEVTGGWTGNTYDLTTWGGTPTVPTITKNATNMVAISGQNKEGALATVNQIDLTDYSIVYALSDCECGQYSSSKLVVTTDKTKSTGDVKNVTICDSTTVQEKSTLSDISDVNGNHYVSFVHISTVSVKDTIHIVAMTKSDDISTLCHKAGISTPSDLATLIADTTSLATIFNNEDAVKFMVAQCTGDFMASVIANSTALGLLKASPYYTTVQANEHWVKFLAMVA